MYHLMDKCNWPSGAFKNDIYSYKRLYLHADLHICKISIASLKGLKVVVRFLHVKVNDGLKDVTTTVAIGDMKFCVVVERCVEFWLRKGGGFSLYQLDQN